MPMAILAPVLSPPFWFGPVLMVVAAEVAELVDLVESLPVKISALPEDATVVLTLTLVRVLVTPELVDEHTSPALNDEQKALAAGST